MGAFCCCFIVCDAQDNNPSNNASSNNCWQPTLFFKKLISKQTQSQAISSPANQQVPPPPNSGVQVLNNNPSDANASHNVVGPTLTQEIGTSRSRIQPEPLEQSVPIRQDKKSRNLYPSLDDEDEDEESCPTCFEEYDEENPKTILKCNHHYHLSCIYEWMERSPECPACREDQVEPVDHSAKSVG